MEKYQYVIYYNPKDEWSCNPAVYYKDYYCTNSFIKFILKFITLKRKFEILVVEYTKPLRYMRR